MNSHPLHSIAPVETIAQSPPISFPALTLVRELTSNDREQLLAHFLALEDNDRLLRFAQFVPDHVMEHYVRSIDFTRDTVFGVFDHQLALVGVGHLAYLPLQKNGERAAEFGVSVLDHARGVGIGTKLFERAVIRSRNKHISRLYMHCLSRNLKIMHIAKKAGMTIEIDDDETNAYLVMQYANPASLIAEILEEQAAVLDYAIKHQTYCMSQWFKSLMPYGISA